MTHTPASLPKPYSWATYPLILYAIAALGDIIGRGFDSTTMDFIFKPLLMPFLWVWFWGSVPKKWDTLKVWISLALLFSWIGDIWLLFSGTLYFLLGLSSFLVAQICYIFAYFQPTKRQFRQTLLLQKPYWALPFLMYGVAFYSVLYPNLGAIQLPVLLYAMMLIGMGVMALNRYGFVTRESFSNVLIGAIFFILSDSCIAFNQFLFAQKWTWGGIVVMTTYIIAQFLIIKGSIQQANQHS